MLKNTALVAAFIALVAANLLIFALPVIGALWVFGWLK
jgi:hypothetical protein